MCIRDSHDGDMYKWMEGVASVYAVNKDPELDKLMDNFIACVVKAQDVYKRQLFIHFHLIAFILL